MYIVELLGVFKNGDYEIRHEDGTLSYRISQNTFDNEFKRVENEDNTTNKQNNTLSLDSLIGLTFGEIEERFSRDDLEVLAKLAKFRSIASTSDDKLIDKLIKAVQ